VENHAHFRKSFLRGTANGRADFGGAKVDVTIIAGLSDLGLVEAAVTPDRRSIRPIVPGLLAWMDKLSAPNFTHAFNFNMVWLGGGATVCSHWSTRTDMIGRLNRRSGF
jgi:hypothetical protein